ncbi:hypothetical protein ES703_63459 [subsurface metagenome]
MDNVLAMCVVQCLAHLVHVGEHLIHRHRTGLGLKQLLEVHPLDKVADDIVHAILEGIVVDGDDVGVSQSRCTLSLALEAHLGRVIACSTKGEDLDGHGHVQG